MGKRILLKEKGNTIVGKRVKQNLLSLGREKGK